MDYKKEHQHITDSIEQKLKRLPKIKDQRPKEVIYQQIINRAQDKRKRSWKKWHTPVFASAAVLLILSIIVPSMIRDNDYTSQQFENIENAELALDTYGFSEEDSINENKLARVEEYSALIEQYVGAFQTEFLNEGEQTVTIPYVDTNAQYIVPLSFVINSEQAVLEQINNIITTYSADSFSLGKTPLERVTFEERNDSEVVINLAGEDPFVGTAEVEMLLQSITALFTPLGYEMAHFTTDGNNGAVLGNYGELEGIELNRQTNGYFLSTTESGYRFLVPDLNAYETETLSFTEMLENMKHADETLGYEATISEDLDYNVEMNNNRASITFSGNVVSDDIQRTTIMIDAMLLAARDAGIEYLEFNGGTDNGYLGPYPINEPISTDLAVNFVY